jgi:hypothetical protein
MGSILITITRAFYLIAFFKSRTNGNEYLQMYSNSKIKHVINQYIYLKVSSY